MAAPVVMIGWDAADFELISRFMAAGELPALASLFARGTGGRLASNAGRFAGGVWPTFYTSREVAWHGLYHNKLWRQEAMRCEIAHESWLPIVPFWERLDRRYRVAVLDVPMTVASPKPLNGVHLAGWGTHDVIARGAWPAQLWSSLSATTGKPAMPAELFGPQTPRTLARLATQLDDATEQLAAVALELLARGPWDLFLVVFGATHRGGHYLWDDTDQESLLEVYRACDRALAKLLAAAPADARVIAFAVHGMGPNTAWADRCADILARIMSGNATGTATGGETGGRAAVSAPKRGLLYTAKQLVPWRLARVVTTRLPQGMQSRLVALWSRRMFDWNRTRAFPLPMDHAGYVRVNLRGREPSGIVEPGAEYNALQDELVAALESFRDRATGRPIVRQVHRLADLAPASAAARDRLPDLVIEWDDVSPIHSTGVVSPQFGELHWPAGELPSGRRGNHRAEGWVVATGPGIPAGETMEGHDINIMDLVPTVCHWLGADLQQHFHGRPIKGIAG